MPAYDARGHEIQVGDIAVYVSGGRYTERWVVRVSEVRTKVQVDRVDKLGGTYKDTEPTGWPLPGWLNGHSLFVVESLPAIPSRLNTKK